MERIKGYPHKRREFRILCESRNLGRNKSVAIPKKGNIMKLQIIRKTVRRCLMEERHIVRKIIAALIIFGILVAAEYLVKSYYYPIKTEKESTGTGWLCDHRNRFGLFSCRFSKIRNKRPSGLSGRNRRTGKDHLHRSNR